MVYRIEEIDVTIVDIFKFSGLSFFYESFIQELLNLTLSMQIKQILNNLFVHVTKSHIDVKKFIKTRLKQTANIIYILWFV